MAPTYPDFNRCSEPSGMPPYAKHLKCCSPYHGEKPVDFTFPTDLPMRRRPSAHQVDDEYVGKYNRAVHMMKELPPEDPRNFLQQANVHCAYCNGAYYMGNTNKRFTIHDGWFFLPWHRWYLYFYERILAKLLGDDTFALPFWNWDFKEGMTIPPMYLNEMLSLYDKKRNPNHGASTIVDLNMNCEQREDQVRYNYKVMYMQIVSARTSRAFHGGRIGTDISECKCAAGTLEHVPHNTVHNWTGNVVPKQQGPCPSQTCYGEDMGNLYSAARDPIFFAHHANVDRMWTLWKQRLGRKDYDDPDLLDSHFFFYDENKCFVRVRVGDCFDPAKLRYVYEDRHIPWLQKPKHTKAVVASSLPVGSAVQTWSSHYDIAFTLQPVKIIVARQQKPAGTFVEELLLIEGIRVQRNIVVKFDVFVNLDDRRVATHYVDTVPKEYAGTFVQLPRGAKEEVDGGCGQSSLCLGISEVLSDLKVGEEESIVVTLIPKVEVEEPTQISAIRMEYYI